MEKEQPTFTFTMTLDELLALRQSLDNLEQSIIRSRDVEIRTIELLNKWKCQSDTKHLHEKVSNDATKGAN